ncbi:MAG: acyl-CoA dehydratase activase-related protein [Defluviitaleaceae bacterium]|nr:acyl-CoA dehydratase activase-related protein [Defluviitaleaceae bacterium]
MKIGIPKAFLYYRYRWLWETFFEELGCEVVLSPDTNKGIIKTGAKSSIDESCLSSKIYLGHVEWLIDKCDYILVPRVASYTRDQIVCSKLWSAYDVVQNVFRDRNVKILDYNIDYAKNKTEFMAFLQMGRKLKKRRFSILRAYFMAKQAEKMMHEQRIKQQNEILQTRDKLKILIVSHSYNINDPLIGRPILERLSALNAIPIIAEIVERATAVQLAREISPTLKWSYNQELLGAIALYKDRIDGIILLTAFPCGPDSLVNEVIIRKIKDKPIISLLVDEQEGQAGLETRIESFIDIINFKRGEVKTLGENFL